MSERGPIAAIDCGTNSIKILVADFPDVLVRDSRVVRLGEGVDETGMLSDAALMRTFGAIKEFREVLLAHDITPDRIRFCATSASRDAGNAEVFTSGVRALLGVTPEVLSGPEEAALVYAGATRGQVLAVEEPVLVVDIGGGSTELVLGADGEPRESVSMDIGSVRLTERHLRSDPPTPTEVAACAEAIDAALAGCGVDLAAARGVIGTSGSIKTIAAGLLHLPAYDRDAIDGSGFTVETTRAYVDELVAMSVAERIALPYMHPGRADVIAAGALIWARILAATPVESYVVSEADLLYGIAGSLVP